VHVADPSFFMWSLVWWPWAVSHGTNPFVTHLVWAPSGFNLAWTTSIPGASLLLWPVSKVFGPVASFNLAMLLAPALSAWTAYLLCRHVTGRPLPSLAGGYLFGFSSYELAQMTAHLNLAVVFLVPLAVLLVLLRAEGRLRPVPFVLLLCLCLVGQLSLSLEVFVTMTAFGAAASLIALAALPPEGRSRLVDTARWTGAAYGLAVVVAGPYLFFVVAHGLPPQLPFWPARYSTDALNLIRPTRVTLFGGSRFASVTGRFSAGLPESGGYLGPLLVVVAVAAWPLLRTGAGRVLIGTLALVLVATLGPWLQIGARRIIPLPWQAVQHLPVISRALPARLMAYAWLAVAVIVAVWLSAARSRGSVMVRWGAVAVVVALLFPNLHAALWRTQADIPAFFSQGTYRRYITPDENVLVIPFGSRGMSMLWQAESGMAYSMSGGYVTCLIPPEFQRWSIVYALTLRRWVPNHARQLLAFLAYHDVRAVLLRDNLQPFWAGLLQPLGRPVDVGGISVYRVSRSMLARYRNIPPDQSLRGKVAVSCA
jgi:hypothetical protein